MGDDDDRVPRLDLVHQVLDLARRDRVQRRAGLVHEDHVRLDGERAGDAQPLRLAAGQAQARCLQPVLHLVPEHGLAQRVLHDLVQLLLVALAVDARPVRDVVVDRLRERIRLLEDHADAAAHGDRGDFPAVQRGPTVTHVTLDPGTHHEVVHPVQRPQHRCLAAPGRADERRDLVLVDVQRHVGDGTEGTVVARHLLGVEDGVARPRRRLRPGRWRRLRLGRCPGRLKAGDDFLLWVFHDVPSAGSGRTVR